MAEAATPPCAPLSAEALPPGWRLVLLDAVDSTGDELRRRVTAGEAVEGGGEGLVVSAAVQTAGRGRRGRTWDSPAGNLYLSLLIAQAPDLATTAQVSFLAALALADALGDVAPHLSCRLKWPNDLLVGGAKVAGILLETHGRWLVLGIGVNLAWAPPPDALPFPATALRVEGARVAPETLRPRLLHHLHVWLERWRALGFAPVRDQWLARAHGLGQPLVARLQDGRELHGRFAGLDPDGALVLEGERGGRERILAGDVFFPPSATPPPV